MGLIAILAIGACLRLYNLDYGLPNVVYVDAFKFVDAAARMVSSENFKPIYYQYPGLYTDLLAIIYFLFNIKTPYVYQFIGCFISALAGVALVAATFFMARSFLTNLGALLASGLSAFCITSVTFSRIPAPDMLMTLFMIMAIYMMLHEQASLKHFALAGVFAGLAAGTKFTGLYLLPWLPVAAWIVETKKSALRVFIKVGVAYIGFAAAFLLTTPWFLPMIKAYLMEMWREFQTQQYGQIGRIQGGYLDYLLSSTITWEQPWLGTSFFGNLGVPLALIGVAAIVWGLAMRGGPRGFFIAAYIAIYLSLISGPGRLKAFRFLLPILPVFYISIGHFIEVGFLNKVKRHRTVLGLALTIVLLAFPAIKSIQYIVATRNPTTNELTRKWIVRNIPAETKLFGVHLFLADFEQLPFEFITLPNIELRQYRLPMGNNLSPENSPIFYPGLMDGFYSSGVRYLIIDSYFDDAFSPVIENTIYFPNSVAAYQEFIKRLGSEAQLVYSIKGWSEHRLGPDIFIYKLK